MTKFERTDELVENGGLVPAKQSYIYVGLMNSARVTFMYETPNKSIHWTKYQIKETDMRIKTATFSSPQHLDLTLGRYHVLITSPYHENFHGLILSVEYDEKNKIYNYQCQDWSRNYMAKVGINYASCKLIHVLRLLLIRFDVSKTGTLELTASELKKYAEILSGVRPVADYDQEKWGSIIKFNPLNQLQNGVVRDKPMIEIIRDLIYGSGGYIDLWWNDYGILQVEPFQKDDFFNTGLRLVRPEAVNRKFKFDTTNIITGAVVRNSEAVKGVEGVGKRYWNPTLVDFFGFFNVANSSKDVYSSLGNAVTTNNNTTKSTAKTTTTKTNPYKSKKVWINADEGSDSMKNKIANKLKSNGWTVKVGRTYSNAHYEDYFNVTKDYIYITLYNGFCAGTVREAYSSSIQNTLKKKNVQLVIMWDSTLWTNPNGMKPYRYGDFTGYSASRAWDDNFSSTDPKIKNVSDFLKKNNAVYCVYPGVDGLVEQFEAGGYFKWKQNK